MGYSWQYRFQKREYTKLVGTQFFPVLPNPMKQLCLGTKSRNLGDALLLTPLFSKLAKAHPGIELSGFIRAFNPVTLENHPLQLNISRGPFVLYGDDLNWGGGHMIEQKFRAFGLTYTENEVKPEIFLTEAERVNVRLELSRLFPGDLASRPLWLIHPWGKTWSSLLGAETWKEIVQTISKTDRVLQVGLAGETQVPGAQFYALDSSTHRSARKLFALMNQANYFLGVDSGPMHVAAAFSVPALILVKTTKPGILKEGMKLRNDLPYFHPLVRHFSNLYDQHALLEVDDSNLLALVKEWIQSRRP